MTKEITGKVYDIQGFSVHDGPGIRTTVFFKGCPLRCPWCHSPESQQFDSQLSWMSARCPGLEICRECIDVCRKGAIVPQEPASDDRTGALIRRIRIDRSVCDDCGDCVLACTRKALETCGTDYTLASLVERVLKDVPFYEQSGGGVTLSGGEPLCQPSFVLQFLQALKQNRIHTALDTTGYAAFDILERALPLTDLFLYDLKHMDSARHRDATGVPNGLILENAEKIAGSGGKIQIRIPVIPNFNDSEENIRATGSFCRSLGKAVVLIQLLPYHSLGAMKHLRIGSGNVVLEADPPADKAVSKIKRILESFGLAVTVH